jgi:single-strand DNA-binding protein
MGRLIADPELRTTPSGISVTSFCVAVDRSYVKSGEERQTDFINVVAWRQTADFVTRYFHKGSMIAVQGSIQTRSYEDKNGNKRTAVEIVADKVSFCGSKSGFNESSDTQTSNYTQNSQNGELSANSEDFEDDSGLPF